MAILTRKTWDEIALELIRLDKDASQTAIENSSLGGLLQAFRDPTTPKLEPPLFAIPSVSVWGWFHVGVGGHDMESLDLSNLYSYYGRDDYDSDSNEFEQFLEFLWCTTHTAKNPPFVTYVPDVRRNRMRVLKTYKHLSHAELDMREYVGALGGELCMFYPNRETVATFKNGEVFWKETRVLKIQS